MSVRPVLFHESGDIDVVFDEQGHSGTIPAAEVVWSQGIDGTDNHSFIVLECPDGCGATSTHPVGGGADAPNVQQMFVHKTELAGCACGNVDARSDAVPEAHVHLNVSRMDGPQRWQLNGETPQAEQQAGQAPIIQIVYRDTDRLVLGTHPRGGVGSDNGVAVIRDLTEWENLMRYDPAYLSQDGDHVVAEPPGVS